MSTAPSNPAELLPGVWEALARNDLKSAEENCRRAVALDPHHIESLGALGYVLHSAGRYLEAEEIFSNLVDLQPAEPSYWMNLGTARRYAGRMDEALLAFANASSRGANSADFFYNVGLTHIDRKDYESGRIVLSQAVDLARDDAEIRYRYALCCYERLLTDDALSALEHW